MHIRMFACTAVFLCSTGMVFAQTGTPNNTNQSPSMPSPMPNATDAANSGASIPGETGQQMQDKIFLRKAVEGGFSEIQFGHLAETKATDPEVKALGTRMVNDHTALNEQLKPFLDEDGVMVPRTMDKKMQQQYDQLSALSGDAFDKAYLLAEYTNHQMDTRDFRNEAIATNDVALKALIDKASLVLREHLMVTNKLAQAHGVEFPKRQPRPGAPAPGSPAPPPAN